MAITAQLRLLIEERRTLSQAEAAALMAAILAGEATDLELAALLGALAGRGETAAEIAGFAQTLRAAATPLPLSPAERETLVDTCGTGGDGSGTFNISTAAALVAAAAGARVAKHGNRAITSVCGSADVLHALGIPTELSPEAAATSLRQFGFCFLLAPALHPALRAVMPVRRALGVRTVLHVLGPLLNPAGARRQVMGVYARRLVPLVAHAMTLLDTTHALVVHAQAAAPEHLHLDELSLAGPTHLAEVRALSTGSAVTETTFTPAELRLTPAPLSALAGGDATQNAAILRSIFSGEPGPRRDVVLLNAAAVLHVAGLAPDLREGLELARHAVASRAVLRLLEDLRGTIPVS